MRESWRDVIGFEGLYQVSNLGRVQSVDRCVKHSCNATRKQSGRVLKLFRNNKYGHLGVGLCKNGIRSSLLVHRVVLNAWVGPCPENHECCHKDGNPINNSINNLRWGSKSSNQKDRYKHNPKHPNARCVRRSDGIEFESIRTAATVTNCGFQNVWSVCNGKRKTTGGFGWKYA